MYIIDKVDFTGIPNRVVSYKSKEAFKLANEQEEFVITILNKAYSFCNWYSTKTFCGGLNPEENRILGDIVGVKRNEQIPYLWIDLKVAVANAENNYYMGTIKLSSLLGFATHKRHAYLCLNKDGSDHRLIMAQEIKQLFETKQCLYTAYDNCNNKKRIVNPELQYLLPKYIKNEYGDVSYNDYIPSFVYLEHLKLN